MAFLGGLVGKLIGVGILIVLLVAAVGVWAYSSDYEVEATVEDKDCSSNPATVDVETRMFGIDHTVDLTHDECAIINIGNFVVYHLRTQRTTIYASEGGQCLYDTTTHLYCGQSASSLF